MQHTAETETTLTPAQQRELDRYRRDRVLTAPPQVLIQLLLEQAIADIDEALAVSDALERGGLIRHAQAVVLELRCSLDLSQGEVAENLDSLYAFVTNQCIDAFVSREPAPLVAARRVLNDVLEGWREIL
jgi:flagellar protein FliS